MDQQSTKPATGNEDEEKPYELLHRTFLGSNNPRSHPTTRKGKRVMDAMTQNVQR